MKCPTPRKVRYRLAAHARLAIAEIKGKGKPGYEHARVYRCICAYYHITSQPRN